MAATAAEAAQAAQAAAGAAEAAAGAAGGAAEVAGVSMEFLLEWMSLYTSYSTADICEAVRKKTAARRCAFVDMLAEEEEHKHEVGPASLFLCHAWSKRFHDTIMAVQEYFQEYPDVRMDDTFVWIDILCVNQHELQDTFEDPEAARERLEETQQIIEAIGQTIVAMPMPALARAPDAFRSHSRRANGSTRSLRAGDDAASDASSNDGIDPETSILRRSWCLWEILCTDQQKLAVALFANDRRQFLRDLDAKPLSVLMSLRRSIRCPMSESSSTADGEQLLQSFETWGQSPGGTGGGEGEGDGDGEESGFDLVDSRVRLTLCRWVAEEAWSLLLSRQKDIDREYDDPFANAKPTREGGQSLRNMLRQQAICMYKITAAFKDEGLVSYAVEICSAMLREHERFRGQIDYDQTTAANLCQLGSLLEESGKYAEAQERYETCLDMSRRILPEFVEDALLGVGHCKWHCGDRASAIEAFEEVVEINRKAVQARPNSSTRRALVNALTELGTHKREQSKDKNSPEAVAILEEAMTLAVSLYPEDEAEETILGLRELAHMLWVNGRFLDAAKHYEKLLTLQELCTREKDEILIRIEDPDVMEMLQNDEEYTTDFRNLARCLMHVEDEKPAALREAAEFCRAALDLDMKRHGNVSPKTLKDLKLLAEIEGRRGNADRSESLQGKVTEIQQRLQRSRLRAGPLVELRDAHFAELEATLPALLANIKSTQKYEEFADGLMRLSVRYERSGVALKAIAYLSEATKLLLFALSKHEPDERAAWRLPPLHRDLRDNLVHLFQLFRVASRTEALVPHCSNFVKMVKFYYRNETNGDNVVLALEQYGRLLNSTNRKREAAQVFEEALGLADAVYGETANEQRVEMMKVLSSIYKSLDDREANMKLNERIVEMHSQLYGEDPSETPAVLYQLAAAQLALAEECADPNDEISRTLCSRAGELLEHGIALLQRADMDDVAMGDAVEENVAILQRELAGVYMIQGRFQEALHQMHQVVELHTILYDEDDPDDMVAIEEDRNFLSQLERRVAKHASASGANGESRKALGDRGGAPAAHESESRAQAAVAVQPAHANTDVAEIAPTAKEGEVGAAPSSDRKTETRGAVRPEDAPSATGRARENGKDAPSTMGKGDTLAPAPEPDPAPAPAADIARAPAQADPPDLPPPRDAIADGPPDLPLPRGAVEATTKAQGRDDRNPARAAGPTSCCMIS